MASDRPPFTSKTQLVYEWLVEEIMSGALAPGQRIRQQQVAAALGVSYTPVREAIRRLQATGLITYEPNRGNAVSTLDNEALRELYMLRGVVEGLGARLAAAKMTESVLKSLHDTHESMLAELEGEADPAALAIMSRAFHSTIIEAGSPQIVLPKVQEIWNHYPVPRSASLWGSADEARRAIDAHEEILRALAAKDAESAALLMESHIAASVSFRL